MKTSDWFPKLNKFFSSFHFPHLVVGCLKIRTIHLIYLQKCSKLYKLWCKIIYNHLPSHPTSTSHFTEDISNRLVAIPPLHPPLKQLTQLHTQIEDGFYVAEDGMKLLLRDGWVTRVLGIPHQLTFQKHKSYKITISPPYIKTGSYIELIMSCKASL